MKMSSIDRDHSLVLVPVLALALSCGGSSAAGTSSTGSGGAGSGGGSSGTGLVEPMPVLSADLAESCMVTRGGALKCWGSGTIGDFAPEVRTPYELSSGVKSVTVFGGSYQTVCLLLDAGGVKCFGSDHWGQLGNGPAPGVDGPVDVLGLTTGVSSIVGPCAVTTEGNARCWGSNINGMVGDGTKADRDAPVDVQGVSGDVLALGSTEGIISRCLVTKSKGVKCWGGNNGNFGNGTEEEDSLVPVAPTGLSSGVSSVAAGGFGVTCAVLEAGGLKCWGINQQGQVGDGTFEKRLTPVDVVGLTSGVAEVSAGNGFVCALMQSGGVKCWGTNDHGQLGSGPGEDSALPLDVPGLSSGVVALACGGSHACAVTDKGEVKCWGDNAFGQLGGASGGDTWADVVVE